MNNRVMLNISSNMEISIIRSDCLTTSIYLESNYIIGSSSLVIRRIILNWRENRRVSNNLESSLTTIDSRTLYNRDKSVSIADGPGWHAKSLNLSVDELAVFCSDDRVLRVKPVSDICRSSRDISESSITLLVNNRNVK